MGGEGGGLNPRLGSQEGAVLGERVRDANFRIGDGARRPAETPHTNTLFLSLSLPLSLSLSLTPQARRDPAHSRARAHTRTIPPTHTHPPKTSLPTPAPTQARPRWPDESLGRERRRPPAGGAPDGALHSVRDSCAWSLGIGLGNGLGNRLGN